MSSLSSSTSSLSSPSEREPMISPAGSTTTTATAVPTPSLAAGIGAAVAKTSSAPRTIWGLDPFQLYTRYWAAMGVQVVRQGEPSPIVSHAELFLLTEPKTDRKSTRLNSSHLVISYAVFCLKKKTCS